MTRTQATARPLHRRRSCRPYKPEAATSATAARAASRRVTQENESMTAAGATYGIEIGGRGRRKDGGKANRFRIMTDAVLEVS